MKRSAVFLITLCSAFFCTALSQFSIEIDAKKDSFYASLTGPTEGYLHIPHTAFLPMSGPAPDNEADLSASIWCAWDQQFFYCYAEIRDDLVRATHRSRPWNDCLELKFDPDPSRGFWGGIVNARLTALDSTDADNLNGVDNLYSEGCLSRDAASPSNYARRRTADGYALELRLGWDWITIAGKTVPVGVGKVFGLSVTIHENDSDKRDGSIQWSVGMADEVWNVPQLLGTVQFQENHRLRFIRRNTLDPSATVGKTYFSEARFVDQRATVSRIENWRYHPGDDSAWARPDFIDTTWEITYPLFSEMRLPASGWTGIGWFRARVAVDTSLWGIPLGFQMTHPGASEVYLDGKMIHRFGSVSAQAETETTRIESDPRVLVFDKKQDHLLAVRYSIHNLGPFEKHKGSPGFLLRLHKDVTSLIEQRSTIVRDFSIYQAVFTAIPLLLVVLHILLFAFYPQAKENLFFAASMLCWALIAGSDFQGPFYTSMSQVKVVQDFLSSIIVTAIVFGLLTMYVSMLGRIPKVVYVFIILGLGVAAWLHLAPSRALGIALYVYFGLGALEMVRIFIVAGRAALRRRWMIATGFMALMIFIGLQIFINLGVLSRFGDYGVVYVYGLGVLSLAVSFDFARTFARTNKNLEKQIRQIEDLSAKALEQERRAQEERLSRRLLEADNARKTQELEEARRLQLSMLPRTLPTAPFAEIAVYTQPASEVGGDYYDFHLSDRGVLTVALGDATGHGMKAGTMVATVKGLFSGCGSTLDILAFFEQCTHTIRNMHLGNLFMAMLIARFRPGMMSIASAGMPPALIHRKSTHQVDELYLRGMPLGAHEDFPYVERIVPLEPGDTVLFMSDGLPELFNEQEEVLDYPKAKELFSDVADRQPKEILAYLKDAADAWRRGQPQNDDITFVVLRMLNGQHTNV